MRICSWQRPVAAGSLGPAPSTWLASEADRFDCASVPVPRAPGPALEVGGGGWVERSTDEIADTRKGLIGLVAEHAVSGVWEDLEP